LLAWAVVLCGRLSLQLLSRGQLVELILRDDNPLTNVVRSVPANGPVLIVLNEADGRHALECIGRARLVPVALQLCHHKHVQASNTTIAADCEGCSVGIRRRHRVSTRDVLLHLTLAKMAPGVDLTLSVAAALVLYALDADARVIV
jgi:hypothetical protein